MKHKKIWSIVILVIIFVIIGSLYVTSNNTIEEENTFVSSDEEYIEQEKPEVDEIVTKPDSNVVEVEKEIATFEQWLASAMLIALTLYEEDVQVEKILCNSECTIEDKFESAGVYIFYKTNGEDACIYANALEEERDFEGKVDLHTSELGFTSFDKVEINQNELNEWNEIEMDMLDSLIEQSLLVSIYEN